MKKVVSRGVDRTGEISTNTEAASSSSGHPCRFNNGVVAEILQDDTAQRRLLEVGRVGVDASTTFGLQWIPHHQ